MDPRTLDTALAWLRAGALPETPAMPIDDFDRRAIEVQSCFTSYPGVLETILAMTLHRPPVNHQLPTASGEFASYALVREGQNQVATALLKYLDHAHHLERNRAHASAHVQSGSPDLEPGRPGGSDAALTDPGFAVR